MAALAAELAALLTAVVALPRIPPFELDRPVLVSVPLDSLEEDDMLLVLLVSLLDTVIEPAPLAMDTAVVPEREAAVSWAIASNARSEMNGTRARKRMMI